jgi:hypothetical protein
LAKESWVQRFLKVVVEACVVALPITILCFVFYLTDHRPTRIDASNGYVHPIDAHGPDIFISDQDLAILVVLIVVLVCAIAVEFTYTGKRR